MASSSSSFLSSFDSWKYHVFISFRGADTRLGFAGYLNDALCNNGIETFFDDEKLQKGADINTTLDKAIRGSRIGLVIFSKNYASSTWCLEELGKIMEYSKDEANPMLVVPVFYRINPSDLRYHKGSYAEALAKHESRIKEEEKWKIEKWRLALNKAAGLSGFHLEPNDKMYEHKFTKEIVQFISTMISSLVENDQKFAQQDSKWQYSQPMQQLTQRQIQPAHPAPASFDLSNRISNLAVSGATPSSSSIEKRGKEKKDKNKVKVGLPYDLKPEFALSEEEYDSASSEEDYGSSYGLKPEFASSKEDYGVGYGRKSKFVSHEKEYGSGYPKLQNNASGYGRKQEKGYGSGYPKKYDNSRGRY